MQAKIKNKSAIELPEGKAVNLFFKYITGKGQVNFVVTKKNRVYTVLFEWHDLGLLDDLVKYINDNL